MRIAPGNVPGIAPVAAIALIFSAVCAGCAAPHGSGDISIKSRGPEAVRIDGSFDTAVYHPNENNVASFYLSNPPLEEMLDGKIQQGQIAHIEVLWTPIAGQTPLDPSAANISIRHIIITDGQVGVYGGVGFATMSGTVGDGPVTLSIENATLSLLHSTGGFFDRLSPALLTGSITAVDDPQRAKKIGLAASQVVTNLLGRPQYVRAD